MSEPTTPRTGTPATALGVIEEPASSGPGWQQAFQLVLRLAAVQITGDRQLLSEHLPLHVIAEHVERVGEACPDPLTRAEVSAWLRLSLHGDG